MKNFTVFLLFAYGAVNFILAASPAYATDNFPTGVYDATYACLDLGSVAEHPLRIISDGKGHVRCESIFDGKASITLWDYPKEKIFVLTESNHKGTEIEFSPSVLIMDESDLKRIKARPLGAKIIDGHPCHGYESRDGLIVFQSWLGDENHHLVLSEWASPGGNMGNAMKLKSWSTPNPLPSAEIFEIAKD